MSAERVQALLKIIDDHLHAVQKVYPVLSGLVSVVGGTGAWAEGAKAQVVPASTITKAFDITGVNVGSGSANTNYELVLYVGAAGAEIEVACIPFTITAATNTGTFPCSTPILAANERISAALRSLTGTPDTATIKITYQEHDLS